MSYTTIDSHCQSKSSRKYSIVRNSSQTPNNQLAPRHSSKLDIFTSTISNYFFKPQKLPIAFEQKHQKRVTAVKPFFTKNRKLLDTKNRFIKNLKNPSLVPNDFRNILRAKSTVIKQNKYQEFYINRERRDSQCDQTHYIELEKQNQKSNLFRTNFPQKKARTRKVFSVNLEQKTKAKKDNLEVNQEMKIPTNKTSKVATIESITEDLAERVLKEAKMIGNHVDRSIKRSEKSTKVHWKGLKHRKVKDKENAQFEIEPWGQGQHQDSAF